MRHNWLKLAHTQKTKLDFNIKVQRNVLGIHLSLGNRTSLLICYFQTELFFYFQIAIIRSKQLLN